MNQAIHTRESQAIIQDGRAQSAQSYQRPSGCMLALKQSVFTHRWIPIFDNFICGSRFELAVSEEATRTLVRGESKACPSIRNLRSLRFYEQFQR